MTGAEELTAELDRLRAELAESRQQNDALSERLHDVIVERGRLLDEVRVYRALREAATLNTELEQLDIRRAGDVED